jgi:hypothetical protein
MRCFLSLTESAMQTGKGWDAQRAEDQRGLQKALLFELSGKTSSDEGNSTTVSEVFAALSVEEVIAHARSRQPSIEIMELKALGKVQVLSCSEHLG